MRGVPFFLLLLTVLLAGTVAPAVVRAAQAPALTRLTGEFEALLKDQARAGRRDQWLALEDKFKVLAKSGKGADAALAASYAARSRQELGKRSFSARDHREAVAQFAATAAAYPKSKVAPDCLYRQADILYSRLGDVTKAISVLEVLQKNYPGSAEAGQGKKLLEQARRKAASRTAAGGGDKAATSPGGKSKRTSGVLEQLGLTVRTIMLDPGHGGKDPGAQAGGIEEKQFTLAMAKRVGALLRKKGFVVHYTRTGNSYISLQKRPDLANAKKADLFISIHANANANAAVRGLETYYLDEAKTHDAALVAARENSVSVKNISDVQFIVTDLMLSSKVKESHHLAECVHRGILQRLKGAKKPAHSNGVRSAPFYVLVGARMPAILVEFGYITNSADAGNLKSEAYLQHQAEGLVDGILQYKAELTKSMGR